MKAILKFQTKSGETCEEEAELKGADPQDGVVKTLDAAKKYLAATKPAAVTLLSVRPVVGR